jgi:hypothetical protein
MPAVLTTTSMPSPAERERLRALARRWLEIAALPVMAERKRAWRALHDLRPEHPMVLFEVGTVADYVRPDELACEDPVLRAAEATMLEHIHHFDEVGDDIVFEPYYRLGWDIVDSGWGVEVVQVPGPAADDGPAIGYTFDFPIRAPADVSRLRPRQFSVDAEGTLAKLRLLEDAFGDILPVKVGNYDHFMVDEGAESWVGNYFIGLTWQIYRFIGNDRLLTWVYDSPETIHALMEYMTQDRLRQFGFLESEGLIVPNTDNQLAGPRAYGYVSELPPPDEAPAAMSDLWCWAESQESTPMSPAMFAEFVLPYLKRLTDRFGLVYYGCCEPSTDRIDLILEAMPNLRSFSVTPWADLDVMAERLGDRHVLSRKPDPVPISGPQPHWERLEADLRRTHEAALANDCPVELLFRDVYDVGGDRSRLARWVELARAVFGR